MRFTVCKSRTGEWIVAWKVPGPATFQWEAFRTWREAVNHAYWANRFGVRM